MVNFLVISLFPQFIVGRTSFLCHDPGLVQLFLKHRKLVRQLLIALVDSGNLGQLRGVELPCGFEFVPLGLKLIESFFHTEFDKEISEEFICLLPSSLGRSVIVVTENLHFLFGGLHEQLVIVQLNQITSLDTLLLHVFRGVRQL